MTIAASRLSHLQAAWVVARRDFTAILFRRTFIFFLLGPLFPVVVMALAGTVGQQVESTTTPTRIGIAMSAGDTQAMLSARSHLAKGMEAGLPEMAALPPPPAGTAIDPAGVLAGNDRNLGAILSGTLAAPVLTGTAERLEWWRGPVSVIAAEAGRATPTTLPPVELVKVAASTASEERARLRTAQAGQVLLFLLIMMLASMVLSNLVEEKGNKIIEILAAAVPMDAVFLGKLFAMLGISLVGITVWGSAAGLVLATGGSALPDMPAPGVGWATFIALGTVYFAMGYLLLGSVFLAIGSLANSVREVQTLSMPVTMVQVLLFFFASLAINRAGTPMEWAAIAFPFSSPFAMLARAAQFDAIWPHVLAIGWQAICVMVFVRLGARLFRKRVMKSGPQASRRKGRLAFWRRQAFTPGSETK